MKIVFLLLFVFVSISELSAQVSCTGKNVFTEAKCVGDQISVEEKELFRIVNEYRVQNKLRPITLSEQLSFVANRHLLDLTNNVGQLTHSWSNCKYEIKDEKTWNCVFDSPTRLNSGYEGNGYENLYRDYASGAKPELALEAWKKSPPHNAMMLNLDPWKNTEFDSFGVAIVGNYAAIWFGSKGESSPNLNTQIKGLGISLSKVINGLTNILAINKQNSINGSEKWVGKSDDTSIVLEIYGQEKNISETAMSISVKIDKNFQLGAQDQNVIFKFLRNLAPNWVGREVWFNNSLSKIMKKPRSKETVDYENRTFEMEIGKDNRLIINVKPNNKPIPKEL